MLRFVQNNYDLYLDYFKTKLLQTVIKDRLEEQKEIVELKQEKIVIQEDVFEVVAAYTQVQKLLVDSVPLGISRQLDEMFLRECREDLLDCTIYLFKMVNQKLRCNLTISENEWELMQNPQNQVLVKLFEKTHSDNAYNIFKSADYEMIKQERSFRDLVIRGYAKSTRENHKESEALSKVAFLRNPQYDLE